MGMLTAMCTMQLFSNLRNTRTKRKSVFVLCVHNVVLHFNITVATICPVNMQAFFFGELRSFYI